MGKGSKGNGWDADTELSMVVAQLRKHMNRIEAVLRNAPLGAGGRWPIMRAAESLTSTITYLDAYLSPSHLIDTTGKVVPHESPEYPHD